MPAIPDQLIFTLRHAGQSETSRKHKTNIILGPILIMDVQV